MSKEFHITSLVVHAASKSVADITQRLSALEGAEIHAVTDEGKFVVTLEGETQRSILDNVEAINAFEGVINSSLIYHQVDPIDPVEQKSEEHHEH
ncbi:sorbose reductase [Shewanella sp. Choline-02u-19]|uniref:chaperone NapD n=1 Tax=Shewanella TaxID=22 RepID=UPI000C32B989|nr:MULTISPECIES: chaperone NapD [Shewanella]MCL1057439.1 chaperone NapD [Shewanella gelidimarina]PKG55293.1 sorbose reductase [Shewanella sp. GutDb-MelDb]PKG73641.1 sorbose reductase [Shewanella sp. GutCb]PKH55598.1 sorbose reductase [Shewanella sp. Bg11-22]PKI29928.1 sorbose reductase [Shewanella sp. Choline-02u-19]